MSKKEMIFDWMTKHLYLVLLCLSIFVMLPVYLYTELSNKPEEEQTPIVETVEDEDEEEEDYINVVVEVYGIKEGLEYGYKEPEKEEPVEEQTQPEPQQQAQQPAPAPTPAPAPNLSGTGDVLMIGDSRTVGIREYAGLSGVTYFCDVGTSSTGLLNGKTASLNSQEGVTLQQALSSGSYSKVYIMLGINEIWADTSTIAGWYRGIINEIKAYQPNAKIVVGATLHVSEERSGRGDHINNGKINELNGKLQALADNSTVFYLDSNVVFDDANGALGTQYTSDGVHIRAVDYKNWGEWIVPRVRGF